MTKPKDNPFVRQLQEPPYVRFVGNGHPFWILREVMRATAGLEDLCSFLFYDKQLKLWSSTALTDKSRAMSRLWLGKIAGKYASAEKVSTDKVCSWFQ